MLVGFIFCLGLLGRDDEAASKVGGHELKGLIKCDGALIQISLFFSCYNCMVPGLCVPLCCLVDYKGKDIDNEKGYPLSMEIDTYKIP